MNIKIYLTLLFSLICSTSLFSNDTGKAVPNVLVTVSPHKFFVEQVAGSTVNVMLMVPAGASSHTFEPSPKQMITASQASIWFCIGEPFETRAIRALQSHNPSLQVVNLQEHLNLISCGTCHCCKGGVDLHFWLSARLAQTQASTIAATLIQNFPEHRALYEANLAKFQDQLKDLDRKITSLLEPIRNRTILVSHPAYGYFCRDYSLNQMSIEVEGKDPTPHQLTQVLTMARQQKIKTIFIQMQYNNKGARLIADEIGAKVVTLDPYSEHYMESMWEIAKAFKEGT